MYCNRLQLTRSKPCPFSGSRYFIRMHYLLSVPFWIKTQPIPALHIPCTAWNITFISMICHFHCCPRFFIYRSASACLEHGRVYGMMGRSDPDCCVTVGVMFWFACFSGVFFNHDIYIRRRKLWCLRLTVCNFHVHNCYYLTMPR